MTREDVLRMAREARVGDFVFMRTIEVTFQEMEHFAHLVRAATKEEDAGICDELEMRNTRAGPADCGAAIRASK